jgi:glutamine synthetase
VQDSKHEVIKLAIIDIDGVPRGKYVNKDKFSSVAKNGLGFCSVVFGWDSQGKEILAFTWN